MARSGKDNQRRDEITAETLLRAYAIGMFPMADSADDPSIFWVKPKLRGVIPLDDFHVPRSLAKTIRRGDFDIRVNTAFDQVVEKCAETAENRESTWINATIKRLYSDMHRIGHAHSVEAWHEGALVGGLYGVTLGAAFFGESMFSRMTDASKVCLVHLVARLRDRGFRLLDTQFTTSHLERFGAIEVPQRAYDEMLQTAITQTAEFVDPE